MGRPAAQYRLDVEAAGDGEISSGGVRRRAERQLLAALESVRPTGRDRAAVDGEREIGAADGEADGPAAASQVPPSRVTSMPAVPTGLPASRLAMARPTGSMAPATETPKRCQP